MKISQYPFSTELGEVWYWQNRAPLLVPQANCGSRQCEAADGQNKTQPHSINWSMMTTANFGSPSHHPYYTEQLLFMKGKISEAHILLRTLVCMVCSPLALPHCLWYSTWKVLSLSFLSRITSAHKVCQKKMNSWQSLGRVEVYMNHIFVCEKFEEEHDVRLKHVWKGM